LKKLAVVISVLAIVLIGVLVWAFIIRNELSETRDELLSVRTQLAMTENELEETKGKLEDTEDELYSTRSELSNTKNELTSTKNTLSGTLSELNSTRSRLSSTETELTSTKSELESTQQKLLVAQETLGGLGITLSASRDCSDVDLVDNLQAVNPTWSQLVAFLSQDETDTHTYITNEYDCSQFSRDVHNNAEAAGIRAAEVHIDFNNQDISHALNAFLTTDYGLVYVDCIGVDTIARIEVGKVYRATDLLNIFANNIRNDFWWDSLSSYYYIDSNSGGEAVTSGIEIFW
jgi:uncharacterized protein (DUF3084 family)